MTITYKGGAVIVPRVIQKVNIAQGIFDTYKIRVKATILPSRDIGNPDPTEEKVIFTKPSEATFTGPQIKESKACKELGIGWIDPMAVPGPDYTPSSKERRSW